MNVLDLLFAAPDPTDERDADYPGDGPAEEGRWFKNYLTTVEWHSMGRGLQMIEETDDLDQDQKDARSSIVVERFREVANQREARGMEARGMARCTVCTALASAR